ncbi:hypothetical protein AB0K16_28250 [Nonomuraea jabiensis]|uniref:hypothetical protein n=1 Tax=Nonomuraea jabiensis TaxID=882448 RepID=UPI00341BFC7A
MPQSAVTLETFVPRRAADADLAAWCAAFSAGQREMSGDPPLAAALAERLLAEEEESPAVPRWAARGDGERPIVGVAELRPQPHAPSSRWEPVNAARRRRSCVTTTSAPR